MSAYCTMNSLHILCQVEELNPTKINNCYGGKNRKKTSVRITLPNLHLTYLRHEVLPGILHR